MRNLPCSLAAATPRTRSLQLLILASLTLLLAGCFGGTGPSTEDPPGGPPGGPPDEPPAAEVTYMVSGYSLANSTTPGVVIHPAADGVTDTSTFVDSAAVTLDGESLAFDPATGHYRATLPAVPPSGSPVSLEILIGDETIAASGTMPASPTITAPSSGTHFAPGDAVTVTWDSTDDPDLFYVSLVSGASAAGHTVLDGAARSVILPRSVLDALPSDGTPITMLLMATRQGAFTGPAHPASTLNLEARTPSAPAHTFTIGAAPPSLSYFVEGSDMGVLYQNVRVYLATNDVVDTTAFVPGLTVTVNGTPLPETGGNRYYDRLPSVLAAGDTLDLNVSGTLGSVTATGDIPEAPILTAPADGATVPSGTAVTITWESTTDPDGFTLFLEDNAGGPPFWAPFLPGTARSHTFPAGTLASGLELNVMLTGVEAGTFSGDFAPGSTMGIRNYAAGRSFRVGAP